MNLHAITTFIRRSGASPEPVVGESLPGGHRVEASPEPLAESKGFDKRAPERRIYCSFMQRWSNKYLAKT